MKEKIILFFLFVFALQLSANNIYNRYSINLSDDKWFLWKDNESLWQTEDIYLNYDEASKHGFHTPSCGWDILMSDNALKVSVPGTAEEYLQKEPGPEGDIQGVTWWSRMVDIPYFDKNQNVMLKVDASRLRAEIFVNRKFCGYQMVENVPYEIDITNYVKPGKKAELNIRITDAGGIHDWRDFLQFNWGEKVLSSGHGFGGITGKVSLEIINKLNISDIYVQNTPSIVDANVFVTLSNKNKNSRFCDIKMSIYEYEKENNIIYSDTIRNVLIKTGEREFEFNINVPNAKIWDIDNPNLYVCKVELLNKKKVIDSSNTRFGFRWFEATGIGEDAHFSLNGKRIMLRSSICWNFWPTNGIYPTEELAKKEILVAKSIGLNMLNMHRFVGYNSVLDYADEMGLLIYEEPGACRLDVNRSFNNSLLIDKVERMVKRDRSRPSLVVYNLMNEALDSSKENLNLEIELLERIHKLDPSRYILRTSAWAKKEDQEEQAKIHMRPFDKTVYWKGWFDFHRATGPASWNDEFYSNPNKYYNNTQNKKEIIFWGEEGALSSPPRLGLIYNEIVNLKNKGWDGLFYLDWYEKFDKFIKDKELIDAYPTVDDLCIAMSEVSYEHQGRKIELARINNICDGYVINGWESIPIENHSGIVDCFRNPKSGIGLLSRYTSPLYISVRPRTQFGLSSQSILFDFYIVNERNIKGTYSLNIYMIDPSGKREKIGSHSVYVTGGNIFGELLLEGEKLILPEQGGMCKVEALLCDDDNIIASGFEDVMSVDLSLKGEIGRGAIWENGNVIKDFLYSNIGMEVPNYNDSLNNLDWVIIAHSPKNKQQIKVPMDALRTSKGDVGMDVVYYEGINFDKEVYRSTVNDLNITVLEGATPDPNVHMLKDYSIIWTANLIPPATGDYKLITESNNRGMIELNVDGKLIYEVDETFKRVGDGRIFLEKNKPVKIEVRLRQPNFRAFCRLDWAIPDNKLPDPQLLMDKVKKDGTKVFILESINEWAEFISNNSSVLFKDKFYVGRNWLGGVMFSNKHPILKELPSGKALNWPFQAIIRSGNDRMGLIMEGEELIVGAYHSYPMALGTAMGIVKIGNGEVLFSTLDIYNNIIEQNPASLVAKKLIFNMIDYK